MIIHLGNAYNTALHPAFSSEQRQVSPTESANTAELVSISDTARHLLAQDSLQTVPTAGPIDAKLAAIQATAPSQRTPEDVEYLRTHDTKLAAILKKGMEHPGSLNNAEMAYWQRTGIGLA